MLEVSGTINSKRDISLKAKEIPNASSPDMVGDVFPGWPHPTNTAGSIPQAGIHRQYLYSNMTSLMDRKQDVNANRTQEGTSVSQTISKIRAQNQN